MFQTKLNRIQSNQSTSSSVASETACPESNNTSRMSSSGRGSNSKTMTSTQEQLNNELNKLSTPARNRIKLRNQPSKTKSYVMISTSQSEASNSATNSTVTSALNSEIENELDEDSFIPFGNEKINLSRRKGSKGSTRKKSKQIDSDSEEDYYPTIKEKKKSSIVKRKNRNNVSQSSSASSSNTTNLNNFQQVQVPADALSQQLQNIIANSNTINMNVTLAANQNNINFTVNSTPNKSNKKITRPKFDSSNLSSSVARAFSPVQTAEQSLTTRSRNKRASKSTTSQPNKKAKLAIDWAYMKLLPNRLTSSVLSTDEYLHTSHNPFWKLTKEFDSIGGKLQSDHNPGYSYPKFGYNGKKYQEHSMSFKLDKKLLIGDKIDDFKRTHWGGLGNDT